MSQVFRHKKKGIKCKALRKDKKSCNSYPMKGSDYCYGHSFGHIKNIPFYKNATIHFIVALLFAIFAFLYSFCFGPTKSNQREIIKHLKERKNDQVAYAEGQQMTEGTKPPRRAQELAANIPDDSAPYDLALKAFAQQRYDDARLLFVKSKVQKEIELGTIYNDLGLLELYAGNYSKATNWYEKASNLKPDDHEALFFVGNAYMSQGSSTIGAIAFEHFTVASGTYERFSQLEPDNYNAFNNRGVAFYEKSKMKEGKERIELLNRAIEQLLKAESIKRGSGAYNLARVYAFQNNEEECRKWLELGGREGTLPQNKYADNNPYFDSMREKEWFKEIRWSEGTEK